MVLRTQAQAEYAAENYGHFGLNLRRYAHFTSPIRRYADLVVHRGLIRALKLGDDGLPASTDVTALGEIAARISAAERRAMKAERETFDRLIAHFLADRIGATFEGRISGVTRAGLFVKLDETGADGFIPARTIGDEYFRYDEERHALIGDRSGETYRLGDRVTRASWSRPRRSPARCDSSFCREGRYDSRPRRRRHAAQRRRRTRAEDRATRAERRDNEAMTHDRYRRAPEQDRARPDATRPPAERRRDADPGRPLRRGAEGAARQAPCAPQVHARQVRVSRRRGRAGRQAMPVASALDPHAEGG